MSEVSHRVTAHMSESVLLQIQELTAKFQDYKKTQRQFENEYTDRPSTLTEHDQSFSFISGNTNASDFEDLSFELDNGFNDRSKDISKLSRDMGQMAELFKQMSHVVQQ